MTKTNRSTLAPLAFGESSASTIESLLDYQDLLLGFFPSLDTFQNLDSTKPFQSKMSSVSVNGLELVSISNHSCLMSMKNESDVFTLLLPYCGTTKIYSGENERITRTGSSASLARYITGGEDSEKCSGVTMTVDEKRLKLTYETMTKHSFDECGINLDNPHQFSLQYGSFSFDNTFKKLYSMIDSHQDNQTSLEVSGIDDMFYRNIVMMMTPKSFFEAPDQKKPSNQSMQNIILHLAEMIHDYPQLNLTLCDLERITGLSARSLQYTFKSQTALSPMQWMRKQKLDYARELLKNPKSDLSVKSAAIKAGFTHYSSFSNYYYQAYGELPSQTISQR